ncbi:TIGR01777 family oxidoreductase [bacterium]|nr:TIGR01777 family oxidoreductase [bacterium]
MKAFISGGRGFVGRHLSRFLLEKGYKIVATSRSAQFSEIADENYHYISADTTKPGPWQKELEDIDVVINLAGVNIFHYWSKDYKQSIYDSRIYTTRNLIDALPSSRNITFISTSAVGFYGNRGEDILNESEPVGRDFLAKVCEDWEIEANKAEKKNARVIITRFGVVADKSGGAMKMMIPPFRFFVGGPLGNGRQWFPWIHLTDLMSAIWLLIEKKDQKGIFNFCAPGSIRNREMAKIIGKLLKRPSFFPVPKFAVDLVIGELGSMVLNSQRAIPEKLQTLGFDFQYPDFEKAMIDILG